MLKAAPLHENYKTDANIIDIMQVIFTHIHTSRVKLNVLLKIIAMLMNYMIEIVYIILICLVYLWSIESKVWMYSIPEHNHHPSSLKSL